MNDIHDEWRELLEPPPGGLARLIDAVELSRRRPFPMRHGFAFAGVGATAMLLVALGFAFHVHRHSPEYRFRSALQTALRVSADAADIEVENGAAQRVPSGDPDLRIYWIAHLPAPKDAAPQE